MEKKITSQHGDQPTAVQRLNSLGATSRKARLRALLPTLDALQRRGVPYSEMAEALAEEGYALKAESVRKALIRWRKGQDGPPSDSHVPMSPPPLHDSGVTPPSSPPAHPACPQTITSKADLVRLRKTSDHIDLNELAAIGRKK
ncbi:hypothetical protein RA224_09350 [Achromobacter aegrifaciens]|uniref:hypothetical protein n=1 Tax=Achromobacter aegrifaciens TaxID=1287736 RepID=UPI0027BA3E98|nr:hypothetical protein [Achromobacter aegrifaciens]WLW63607.1 hypothetical protein RA224_09350 [Achromobacter aegrifaciens]